MIDRMLLETGNDSLEEPFFYLSLICHLKIVMISVGKMAMITLTLQFSNLRLRDVSRELRNLKPPETA